MCRVEEVRRSIYSETDQLKDRLDAKMEAYQNNRELQLSQVQERLQDHVSIPGDLMIVLSRYWGL